MLPQSLNLLGGRQPLLGEIRNGRSLRAAFLNLRIKMAGVEGNVGERVFSILQVYRDERTSAYSAIIHSFA